VTNQHPPFTDQHISPKAADPLSDSGAIDRLTIAEHLVSEPAADKPANLIGPVGGPLLERPNLTGDWFGTRTAMRDDGITWNIPAPTSTQGSQPWADIHSITGDERTTSSTSMGRKPGFGRDCSSTCMGVGVWRQRKPLTGTLLPVSLAQSLPTGNGSSLPSPASSSPKL